jgi:crotonobetainyl-CoA:carnitine CoA-transferase CaiB-like acyl-CoA transferase
MSWPRPESGSGIGPLHGVRVLDLSRILAGPYASMLMGDLGADVIKVEQPSGDETRRWGPPFVGDTAAYFYTANRSRRSITLDLKQPDDRALAQQLAADADVVVENFLPDTAERLGVDHKSLRALNPALVHCTISGYGATSRRAGWPALDFVIQAHAGIIGVTGTDSKAATKAGAPVADMATGLFAAVGVIALLLRARDTGVGAHVEVALADACTCLLANQAMNWLLGGVDPRPAGNTHPNIAPYQTIAARDRPVAVAATSDAQFHRLCEVLNRQWLIDDPRFATNAGRVAHRTELIAELDDALSREDAREWVARLNDAGVAAATINSVAELLEDPDTRERMVDSVSDGEREVPQLRAPIRIDGEPLAVSSAPPRLGADSDAIRAAIRQPRTLGVNG